MQILKRLRQSKNLYQKDVAAFLGIDRTTYVKYESGASEPDFKTIKKLADYFDVSVDYLLGREQGPKPSRHNSSVRIPVLGYVPAGLPIEAVEDILDYEEITPEMARNGEHFALKIKGDSMTPIILNGDIVIVRLQPDVESGETAIIKINGDEATCKKVVKQSNGISIVANNPVYEPRFFSNEEVNELPVTVIGKVVELRRSF